MHRFSLMISFLLILFSPLHAQRFSGGIVLGYNASQVDGDTWAGYNKFGLVGGFYTSTSFSGKLSGELQICYSQKGAAKRTNINSPTIYRSALNYIEMPVLLKYTATPKISFSFGPTFDYLFSFKEEDEYGQVSSAEAIQFKPFELGGLAGVNYQWMEKLSVSLFFSYSILPVADHHSQRTYQLNRGVYNNLIRVQFSYRLSRK